MYKYNIFYPNVKRDFCLNYLYINNDNKLRGGGTYIQ